MPSPAAGPRAFLGTALHAPRRSRLEYLADTLIECDAAGRIAAILGPESPDRAGAIARHTAAGALTVQPPGTYLVPGLVDLHVHAPQWPQLGLALDLPLEEWLQKYTFPLEARYADAAFAAGVYESLVAALLANGTTTAVYYGSVHLPATMRLADICHARGQRALVGRVAMDNPAECPDFYRDESAASALADTRAFIDYVRGMSGNADGLVRPVITPRFIPSCTDALLEGLGDLARATGCHVQTHCSESDWEHAYVQQRCGVTDTQALARFGLLTRHTVLAHGNFIGDADFGSIAASGAAIAHCPLSNVYFSDAIFPLRQALEHGVHVGLGTDIAGGASPSVLENARHAVIASRRLEAGADPALARARRGRAHSRIDALTAFWLATTAGGIALDLPIGTFQVGYAFDALSIDASAPDGNLRVAADDTPENILQKIVYHATRANIRDVWVQGRLTRSRAAHAGAA